MSGLINYRVQQRQGSVLQQGTRTTGGLTLALDDTIDLNAIDVFAAATAAITAPSITIKVSPTASAATASVVTPVVKVSIAPTAPLATARVTAPGVFPSTSRSVTAVPAIAYSFILIGTYPSSFTYPGSFLSPGESSSITPKITVTAIGTATAAVTTPVPNVKTGVMPIAPAVASVVAPSVTKTGNAVINHIAPTATAAGLSPLPKLSVSSVASATGANTAPVPKLAIAIQQLFDAHTEALNPPVVTIIGPSRIINSVVAAAIGGITSSVPKVSISSVANAVAAQLSLNPFVEISVVPVAVATATNSAPTTFKTGNAVINHVAASAVGSNTLVAVPKITVSTVANASAANSSPAPTVLVSPTTAASATTSNAAPVITHVGANIFINSNPIEAIASAASATPKVVVTSPATLSTAAIVLPVKRIDVGIPVSNATAANAAPTVTHVATFLEIFPFAAEATASETLIDPVIIMQSDVAGAFAETLPQFTLSMVVPSVNAVASVRTPFIPTSSVAAKGYGITHVRSRVVSARIYS